MLGKLFGSNARVKILKIFLLNPGKKYFIRQLARDLKLQVNSVRRELENLEDFGILTSSAAAAEPADVAEPAGGQEKKFYRANAGFVLFEEIKSLIVKAQILYSKEFEDKLRKIGKPKLLLLTGNFVNAANCPIDMLIIGQFNKPKLVRLIRDLEKEICREINYTLMDYREFKYRRDMTDVFLYSILEGRKIVMIDEVGIIYGG